MESRKPRTFSGALLSAFAAILLFISFPSGVLAQGEVTLDLILQPQLTRSQVISISSLGFNRSGRGGRPLFDLVIRNNENRIQNDLYLNIQIQSSRNGLLVELYQVSGLPFSLKPNQSVVANNIQLEDGIPGIQESIDFDGGLTDEGEEFLNSLSGSTRLPADIYTITLSVYQGNNSRNGGELLASVQGVIGDNLMSDSTIDLYLLQPGGELGSDEITNSPLPVFRWDGPPNQQYRLLLVRDNGQSPESLLQAALSTEPAFNDRSRGTGGLLEFEVIDATLNRTTYPFPPSGAQRLETGVRYYWQVFTQRETVDGIESVPSEIWEFTHASQQNGVGAAVNQELQNSLRRILGSERYNELRSNGFQFSSIVQDGQEFQGAAGIIRLQEIDQQLVDGNITIVIN